MIEDEKEGIRWYWYTTQNKTVFVIIPVLCQLLLRNPKQNPTIKITYDFGLKNKNTGNRPFKTDVPRLE